MHQRWENLLFLCWIVRPADLQRTLAEGLRVHTRDGNAHFGLAPFFCAICIRRVTGIALAF
jgi:uncharacterized protein YqjF (DUF2071 family)